MSPSDFTYINNFIGLDDTQVGNAIAYIESVYAGSLQLYDRSPEPVRTNIRTALENLLVAWYLANVFPDAVTGIVANGGMPVHMKSIGGVNIAYSEMDTASGLKSLTTNTFGIMALEIIHGAPERYYLYG